MKIFRLAGVIATLSLLPLTAQASGTLFGADGDESLGSYTLDAVGEGVAVLSSDSGNWPQPGTTGLDGGTDLVLVLFDATNPTHTLYYGGSGDEVAHAVAVADDGTIWVAGSTTSDDLVLVGPLAEGAACTGCAREGFVARFSADGSQVLFATYLGGGADGKDDEVLEILPVPDGVVVVGRTTSGAFPVRGGPLQGTHGNDVGANDGFFAHLVVDGAGAVTLAYATFLGGNRDDSVHALARSATGRLYLGGWTESDSATFSLTQAFDDTASAREGLLYALDPAAGGGYEVAWSSFLGGLSDDAVHGLVAMENGLAVVGQADSGNFAPAAQATLSASPLGVDAFLVRLLDDGDRGTIAWWTFAGGSDLDRFTSVAAFPDGQLAVAGATSSVDLLPVDPREGNALGLNGTQDALVSVYAADGLSLLWSEIAGGAMSEQAVRVVAESTPRFGVSVAGDTDSTDFLSANGRTPAGTNTFVFGRGLYTDVVPPVITDLTATFTAEGGDRFRVEAGWTATDADTQVKSTLWSVEPVADLEANTAHGPVEVGTLATVNQAGLSLEPGVSYAVLVVVRDASGLESSLLSDPFLVPGGEGPDGGTNTDGGDVDDPVLEPVFGWSCHHLESTGVAMALFLIVMAGVLLGQRRRS